MESFSIEIEPRSEEGKSAVRRMRKEGRLPAVVYHRGDKSLSVTIEEKQFVQLARAARSSQIFRFKSKDKALDGRSALVKEVQKDYLRNEVLHVDFLALREDEVVTVKVPISLVGEAPGVKLDGGILQFLHHEVAVSCLPKHIPSGFEVDISSLRLNQSIHAGNVTLPEHVELADDADETIVTILAVRSSSAAEGAGEGGGTADSGSAQ